MKTKDVGVASKGSLLNKAGRGVQGGGAQHLPPQCGQRKKRIGTQIIDAAGQGKRNKSR